jgi:DNA-3-methyladenine glycosylase I
MKEQKKTRCTWCTDDPIYIDYHDKEWGIPVYDSQTLFEFLLLEGAQAGLNWLTILKKRSGYRACFANFNPEKIARFDEKKINALLQDTRIVRNRLKVKSAINNAKAYLKLQDQGGVVFSDFLWQFVDGQPIINQWRSTQEVPAHTKISDALAKSLKKRGFSFVGTTICYALMQAVGMVDDHTQTCYKRCTL